VPRASLVVVAAVLPMFGLPEAGLLLILGIDQFLDMGRTATNVVGNGIATAVVAKWEGDLLPAAANEEERVLEQAPVLHGSVA
jgi:Na+/H+-dicarboxylate symporter